MSAEFLDKLRPILEQLGEIGANDCGDLSWAQAALFHNATQILVDLEDNLTEESASE
jgi:hypothetical protein